MANRNKKKRAGEYSVECLRLHTILEEAHERVGTGRLVRCTIHRQINGDTVRLVHLNSGLRHVVAPLVCGELARTVKFWESRQVRAVCLLKLPIIDGNLVVVEGDNQIRAEVD